MVVDFSGAHRSPGGIEKGPLFVADITARLQTRTRRVSSPSEAASEKEPEKPAGLVLRRGTSGVGPARRLWFLNCPVHMLYCATWPFLSAAAFDTIPP
jgi:hypothetical protein